MQRNGYWNATESLWGRNELAIGAQRDHYGKTATLLGSSIHRYDLPHAFISPLTYASIRSHRARHRARLGTVVQCVSLAHFNPCSACHAIVIGVQQEINRGATNSLWAERNVTATRMQRNHYGDARERLLECAETTLGMQRSGCWNATEPLWKKQ